MQMKVVLLLAALCATAMSLPNPGAQSSHQLLTRWDEQEDCEKHGFRWDGGQKCCFDHDNHVWHDDHDNDNNEERHWERLQRECEKKGNRWDGGEHCCFDKDNKKVDHDDNDGDDNNEERHWERLQRECEGRGERWDWGQKCCFDGEGHKVG